MTGEPTHTASKKKEDSTFLSERMPMQLSITGSKVKSHHASLSATFSLLHSATNEKTVSETPLQSIQSPQKIQTIPVYKWESIHCATANRHLGQ